MPHADPDQLMHDMCGYLRAHLNGDHQGVIRAVWALNPDELRALALAGIISQAGLLRTLETTGVLTIEQALTEWTSA